MSEKKKKSWCSWSMCYVLWVMYSSIKWMLDHLILYENFCSSSEFCSLCYFSACAISFFSHSARFFRLYFNLPSSFFFISLCPYIFHFSFVHCWTTVVVVLFIRFRRVLFFFSLLFRFSFTRLLREKKNDWCLCSSIYFPLHKCISQAFIRSLRIINKFFRTPFAYYDRFE